jgi:hypothetical protein
MAQHAASQRPEIARSGIIGEMEMKLDHSQSHISTSIVPDCFPIRCRQQPLFHPALFGWMISAYSDVASVLSDFRCVPTIIGSPIVEILPEREDVVRDRHAQMKNGLGEIVTVLEEGMPALLASAAQSVLNEPRDLVQDLLKPWCLKVAACALGIAPELHFRNLADRVFAASAFPYDAGLRATSSSATVELSTHLNTNNPIALQTFIALATSLPGFIGNAWALLFHHQEQLRRFHRTPELAPLVVEECLRLGGPPCIQFRRVSCDIDVGAVRIRRNANLLLMIQSANRDPTIFAEPDTFDIARTNNPHLALGRGGHACVGAHLVRSISRRLTVTLLSRFKTVEVIEPPQWRGLAIRFLDRLPVVFRL